MSLLSFEIPGLYNGVSQQAPSVRLPSQCEQQINILSSVSDGIDRRPPSEWVAKLSNSNADNKSFYYLYSRAPAENYMVIFTGHATTPIEIYRCETGAKCTVNYGEYSRSWQWTARAKAKDYVKNDEHADAHIRVCAAADHMIVVNRSKATAMDTSVARETKVYQYIVWVKQVAPSINWTINCCGASKTISVGDKGRKTEDIAGEIKTHCESKGCTVNQAGSVLRIYKGGQQFLFTLNDGYGNRASSVICNGETQKFADLPPVCFNGVVIKITQDESSKFDSYYVKFIGEPQGQGRGHWEEYRGWNIDNYFDKWTMPHRLIRMSENTFAFCPCNWEERKVGDNVSAPYPSFRNRGIWNVFFYRSRLGFISGDNVVMSRTSDFFNFWPKTALDVNDDDPIDIACVSERTVNLRFAKPFEKQLVIMSDHNQFVLSGDPQLTPTTVVVDEVLNLPAELYTDPANCGSNLYFLSPNGQYNKMREYLVQPDTLTTDAPDITAHVPRYLPAGRGTLEVSPALDLLFYHPYNEHPNSVYVYRFYWHGTEKLMSSWSQWTFKAAPLCFKVSGTTAWLIISHSDELHLEKIELENQPVEAFGANIHLDRRVSLTGTYNAVLDKTLFNLPYSDTSTAFCMVSPAGTSVSFTKASDTQLRVTGDVSGVAYTVGKLYTSKYRFSEIYLRDDQDNSVIDGRFQLRFLAPAMMDTGYLRVEVTAPERSKVSTVLTNSFINRYTGIRRAPVLAENRNLIVDLVNDTFMPFRIYGAVVEGYYSRRSRPL